MEPGTGRTAAEEPGGAAADVAGVVVFGCCAAWALITAAGREARPEGALLAMLAVAAGYALGRIGGALLPVAAPVLAASAGIVAVAAAPYGPSGTLAVPAPGHAGADAAQLALAAGAACCAAWSTRRPVLRTALRLGVVAMAVAGALLGSPVGSVAALVVLLCSLAAAQVRRRLLGLAGCALAALLVAGGTWALAEGALPRGLSVTLEGRLTESRLLLWRDAVDIAGEHPVLGAGPDRFAALSETVAAAPLSDGTPHSAALQLAAEQGLPGVALLGAAFGWTLLALGRSTRPTPVVLTAGASLTLLAALASVGNALSFAHVTVAAGLLAGLATARPMPQDELPSGSVPAAKEARPAP